jgi:hypothetical protein
MGQSKTRRQIRHLYADDPRFTATYDNYRPGLAVFMRDAMAPETFEVSETSKVFPLPQALLRSLGENHPS